VDFGRILWRIQLLCAQALITNKNRPDNNPICYLFYLFLCFFLVHATSITAPAMQPVNMMTQGKNSS